MTLEAGDFVWAFDGRDGRGDGLAALLGFYLMQLRELLPPASDDPFEQIAADFADDPTARMQDQPRFSRLYPPAYRDDQASDDFWRDSIADQTRARVEAAETVLTDLASWEGYVPVAFGRVEDWAKTLGGLRVFWYSELAGPDRLAQPSPTALVKNARLVDLVEWLGFVLEDLLESREACLNASECLDPDQFVRAARQQ